INIEYREYVVEDPIKDYDQFFNVFFNEYANDLDGVFVENDNLALLLIQHGKELGIDIPNDLAVVGFDGVFFSRMFIPDLTTIVQSIEQLAVSAVQELIQKMDYQ